MATTAKSGVFSRPLYPARMSPEPDTDAGVDLKQLKEELTCSICLEVCIRPCSTSCGHSFCRRCLRDAMRYSPKCPKCREVMSSGSLNVNSVLWNTIRMLFPKTNEAPASPPDPSPIRQATDRRHLRQNLTAREAEMLRRIELDRASRNLTQSQSRMHSGESHSSHRRRRMSPLRQESHVARSMASATLRGQPVSAAMTRAHHAAGSVGGSQSRSRMGQDEYQHSRPSRHGIVGSSLFENHALRTRVGPSSDRQATNEPRSHREDYTVQEMLSSSEYPWIQTLNGQRRAASGVRTAHGSGAGNSLSRSASYGDLQNDVEYVTVQRVQRLDQVPLHRRHGVYRLEHVRNRLYRRNMNQNFAPVEIVPVDDRESEIAMDPNFEDDDDFETASDIISDRDSSFTSSIAAPFGSRANSFRFHEDGSTSPVSIAAASNDQPESAVASFAGYERLYDISSQIEAAMDQIERLSMQPGWSRPPESSQPPTTPLTHRSCFQLSDEEDEDEDLEWNSRIRDAVFIVDDLETDSESDAASVSFSPFDDVVDDAVHPQRIRPVEEEYYY